jgi:hypothetical protein
LAVVDIFARVGGISMLLIVIGMLVIRPLVSFDRDNELIKQLYQIAPIKDSNEPKLIDLSKALSNVEGRKWPK